MAALSRKIGSAAAKTGMTPEIKLPFPQDLPKHQMMFRVLALLLLAATAGISDGIAQGFFTPITVFDGTTEDPEIKHISPARSFGSADIVGGRVVRTYTIVNTSTSPVNLRHPPVNRPFGAGFFLSKAPASPLAPSASTTFQLTFDPWLPDGSTSTMILIVEGSQNPFIFVVYGNGRLSTPYRQSISFSVPGTVYLSEGPVTLVAEANTGLPVTLEVLSGPGTLAGGVLTLTGVGKVTVRATQRGGSNFAPAKAVTRVITVKADPNVLTLTGLSQRYDGTPKAIGTVGAAGMVAVSYQVGGVFGPDAPTAAGRYPVRAEADGVTKTATLVITKAPLYLVPVNKRKFAGEANPALTLEYEGFVGADDETVLTSAPTLSTTAKTTSPGGVYPITAKGGAAANYALVYRQGSLVVESFASGYEALLVDALEVPSGKLSLTVAKSGRSFSGSMALAGETTALRVSGPLVTNTRTETASGAATVVRKGVTYALTFTLPMIGQVTGAVTRASLELATAQGGRRLLSLPRGGKVNYSGAHTAVLNPAQPAGAGVPAGAGWARATINSRGAIALVGKLGDGTAFTTSLLPDAEQTPGYRLWLQPYKPARVDAFLGGTFSLKQHPVLSRGFVAQGASLTWAKAERLPDKSYPEGFVPVTVGLKLDPWIKPSAVQPLATLLGLSAESIEVAHSPTGSASVADLPTTITLNARNAVSVPGASNPTNWKARLNTSNGTFTGSFERLDAGVKRLAPFSGVLRQPVEPTEDVIGDGHFLIPEAPGALEKVSGEVLFTRP
jgi:MBG domain (YGX type)